MTIRFLDILFGDNINKSEGWRLREGWSDLSELLYEAIAE